MIGPSTMKVPDKLVCIDCEAIISKTLGGTKIFPNIITKYYCKHPELDTEVAYIRDFPNTPKWCPAKKGAK